MSARHIVLCADAREVNWSTLPSADLVLTDPPWRFDQANGKPPPYPCLSVEEIVDVLVACGGFQDHVGLAVWVTAAHFGELIAELVRRRLPLPVTLGAWDKGPGRYGQGAWWASRMEFLFRWSGGHADRSVLASNGVNSTPGSDLRFDMDRSVLANGVMSQPDEHSAKPELWQAALIERWCPPDGVVVDPFMGLGSVQRAARRAGRAYVGVEADLVRWERAVNRSLSEGRGPLQLRQR